MNHKERTEMTKRLYFFTQLIPTIVIAVSVIVALLFVRDPVKWRWGLLIVVAIASYDSIVCCVKRYFKETGSDTWYVAMWDAETDEWKLVADDIGVCMSILERATREHEKRLALGENAIILKDCKGKKS